MWWPKGEQLSPEVKWKIENVPSELSDVADVIWKGPDCK